MKLTSRNRWLSGVLRKTRTCSSMSFFLHRRSSRCAWRLCCWHVFSLRIYCGPSGWRLTRCMSETAKWSVDNETASLESMGSSAESLAWTMENDDPPCAAPKCWNWKRPRIQRQTHPSGKWATSWTSNRSSPFVWEWAPCPPLLRLTSPFSDSLHQCRARSFCCLTAWTGFFNRNCRLLYCEFGLWCARDFIASVSLDGLIPHFIAPYTACTLIIHIIRGTWQGT